MDLKAKHRFFVEELDEIIAAQKTERNQAKEDRAFYSIPGAMWSGKLGEQFANKPKFEINKVHKAVIRLFNDFRNNRIDIEFIPRDGVDKFDVSDALNSLFRADQQDSNADDAEDNAFEEAAGGGMGAFRLSPEYENEYDEDDDRQRIRWVPIFDADQTVYFDLGSKRQDKSDAKRCYVLTAMTESAFESEFGRKPMPLENVETNHFDWRTDKDIYVAEVYEVTDRTEKFTLLRSPTDSEETRKVFLDPEDEASYKEEIKSLTSLGWTKEKERSVKRRAVHKYIIDGAEILEECGRIAGEHIPVIVMYGKRWVFDGIERFMGAVRLAKDPSRLKNMLTSLLAEQAASSGWEKPIMTPEQVRGHEQMWARDNIDQNPYLLVNPLIDEATGNIAAIGPANYTKPPTLSPALAAVLQVSEVDIADVLGNQNEGEKIRSNISGDAIELVQTQIDANSFIYMSQAAKAKQRAATVWLSMAKELYHEKGRRMKSIGIDGATDFIELQRPMMKDGQEYKENDLSTADVDVTYRVGPSSDSKRASVAKNVTALAQITQDPAERSMLIGFAIQNFDGEGLGDLREYYRRKNVVAGISEPTEEDKKRMEEAEANKQPDPNTQYLQAEAAKAMADAKEAESRVALNVEKAVETRVKAAKTMAETEQTDIQSAQSMGQQMNQVSPTDGQL